MKDVDVKISKRRIMTPKITILILSQCILLDLTTQSITGVTYTEHFNFEDRYRNVHECDPFYWHPLHLPEDCAEMYEKLIRSRMGSTFPVRNMHSRNKETIYKMYDDFEFPMYESDTPTNNRKHLSFYDKMLESLTRDVMENPTAPVMKTMSNLGLVAVYKQPVSKKSENLIKVIGRAYAKAGQSDSNEGSFYGRIDVNPSKLNKNPNNYNNSETQSDDKTKTPSEHIQKTSTENINNLVSKKKKLKNRNLLSIIGPGN